jgi:hypothetical protein
MKHMGSGCIDPCILDFSTTWRWVVSLTPRLLYHRRKSPSTDLIGGWVGPTASLGDMKKIKSLSLPELELFVTESLKVGNCPCGQWIPFFHGTQECITFRQSLYWNATWIQPVTTCLFCLRIILMWYYACVLRSFHKNFVCIFVLSMCCTHLVTL